jgi:beta-lactam-binding protein with PASTA domain
VLDGKYEITSEQEVSSRETLFGATAPDGTALRISWYDLSSAEDEGAFERYRALLRQLKRAGHAAVYDLVARPGAHYVAWRVPGEAGRVPVDGGKTDLGPIEKLLADYGRTLAEAHICTGENAAPQVYALAFQSAATEPETALPASTGAPRTVPEAVDNLWITLRTTLLQRLGPWLPGAVLALSGGLLLLLSTERLLQNRLVSVPDVRGQQVNQALGALYRAGFSTTPVALASARPAGEVLEVSPPVGTPLRPGRTLSVRYALPAGRAPELVPAVLGATLERAEAALEGAGFAVGEVALSYSSAPTGTVVAQTPAAEALAAQGSRIGLLVSDGPRGTLTFLPDLTGLPQEDALRLAEAAGFAREAVRLERSSGTGVAAGMVLAQNIAPFVSVPEGRAQLRLTVADRRVPATSENGTPELVGLSLADAQERARLAGLNLNTAARVSTPELPSGVVLQRPAPGTPLEGSVSVTLNVPAVTLPRPQVRAAVANAVDSGTDVDPDPVTTTVRRARYLWQLGADAEGKTATITVETADGSRETIVQGQRVGAGGRLGGTYLSTARGPLTFRLTLSGVPYGAPLTVDP